MLWNSHIILLLPSTDWPSATQLNIYKKKLTWDFAASRVSLSLSVSFDQLWLETEINKLCSHRSAGDLFSMLAALWGYPRWHVIWAHVCLLSLVLTGRFLGQWSVCVWGGGGLLEEGGGGGGRGGICTQNKCVRNTVHMNKSSFMIHSNTRLHCDFLFFFNHG